MDHKVKFILRYSASILAFWITMAFLLAAARYASNNADSFPNKYWGVVDSFGDLVVRYFSGLTVAVLLVPLLGVYAYRLVLASQPRVWIAAKILAATIVYYMIHVVYFIGLARITYGVSPIQVLTSLSFVEWVWGIFFVLTAIVGGLALGFNKRRQQAEKAKLELDKMLLEMETKMVSEQNDHIKQRLGSHFVLNALSNIIALVRRKKNDEAIRALHLLSDILRDIAHSSHDAMHRLEDELVFLRKYLSFQGLRFPDLKVQWEIMDETKTVHVPSHILQPLVENAFKHGMQADGKLEVSIAASMKEKYLSLEVANTVAEALNPKRQGEGQTLTRLRLQKAFNREDLFSFQSLDTYYRSEIRIPLVAVVE